MGNQSVSLSESTHDDRSSTHLDEIPWLKNRIRFNVQLLKELRHLREEERDNSNGRLSDGRRKWFNRELDSVRTQIDHLESKLDEVGE
jgi:hypothetical protein